MISTWSSIKFFIFQFASAPHSSKTNFFSVSLSGRPVSCVLHFDCGYSMEIMGIPISYNSGLTSTSCPSTTRFSPPFNSMPFTFFKAFSSSTVISCGCISLYTPRSRISRASTVLLVLPISKMTIKSCFIR